MKKIIRTTVMILTLCATAALAFEFSVGEHVPAVEEKTPVEYRFTPQEVAAALKLMVEKKYGQRVMESLDSDDCALVWWDTPALDAGHAVRWESLYVPATTNHTIALVVRVHGLVYDFGRPVRIFEYK